MDLNAIFIWIDLTANWLLNMHLFIITKRTKTTMHSHFSVNTKFSESKGRPIWITDSDLEYAPIRYKVALMGLQFFQTPNEVTLPMRPRQVAIQPT